MTTRRPVSCRLILNCAGRKGRMIWAVRQLARLPRSRLIRCAAAGDRRAIAEVKTSLSPMGLLIELKRLEVRAGRKPAVDGSQRPLDIGIISYGGKAPAWIKTPQLL